MCVLLTPYTPYCVPPKDTLFPTKNTELKKNYMDKCEYKDNSSKSVNIASPVQVSIPALCLSPTPPLPGLWHLKYIDKHRA